MAGAAILTLASTPGTKTRGEVKRKCVYYRTLVLAFPCLLSSKKQALTWGLQRRQRDAYVRTESSTTTDLVLPRPGFLLIDVTRFLSLP